MHQEGVVGLRVGHLKQATDAEQKTGYIKHNSNRRGVFRVKVQHGGHQEGVAALRVGHLNAKDAEQQSVRQEYGTKVK
jgi:hypothetical protein